MYTVVEGDGEVEVCVNLTRPMLDILDEMVIVNVINDPNSTYIPVGALRASEPAEKYSRHYNVHFFYVAPDMPDFLNQYLMVDGTDFAEQTMSTNLIDDRVIIQQMRIVCYNQTIYEDTRLEASEYAGLALGVSQSTIRTDVQPMYGHAAIRIIDNDSKFSSMSYNVWCYCCFRGCGWSGEDNLHSL